MCSPLVIYLSREEQSTVITVASNDRGLCHDIKNPAAPLLVGIARIVFYKIWKIVFYKILKITACENIKTLTSNSCQPCQK